MMYARCATHTLMLSDASMSVKSSLKFSLTPSIALRFSDASQSLVLLAPTDEAWKALAVQVSGDGDKLLYAVGDKCNGMAYIWLSPAPPPPDLSSPSLS